MKRYGSMEKSVIYVSILAFIGVVTLIVCLGMAAASDNSVVANVNNVETEKIGITLNTKDGLVLDTSLNNEETLTEAHVNDMLTIQDVIKSDIISVNLPSATTIGDSTFSSCNSLTSVNFPDVTTIDDAAFFMCNNLTSVNFPKAITIDNGAFYKCDNLTSVNFPNVTTIGSAFFNCYSLTSVNFPNAETIGVGAFFSCSRLTSVNFPITVTLTGTGITNDPVFSNCYRLGEGIKTLNVNANSVFVVNDNTGTSQGRNAATYSNGVITFNPT